MRDSATSIVAATVWTGAATYSPGRIEVARGRVVRVGPASRRARLTHGWITPGFVNAHAHLALPALGERVTEFVPWVRAVLAARRAEAEGPTGTGSPAARVAHGLDAMRNQGCVAVGEIDSDGAVLAAATARMPVVVRRYRELLGYDLDAPAASEAVRVAVRDGRAARAMRTGLSPHAPYSVSEPLLRAAVRSGRPLQVHVAESEEEVEFLQSGTGPFRDLLEDLGRLPPDWTHRPGTAVDWLDAAGALGPRTTLIHAQHLEARDVERIAESGSPIVVCPGTIEYFDRAPPPVEAWLRAGIRVGIGTDSAASVVGGDLDVRAELRRAHRLWPSLSAETLLWMATVGGALALQAPTVAEIRVGGSARFLEWGRPDERAGIDSLVADAALAVRWV